MVNALEFERFGEGRDTIAVDTGSQLVDEFGTDALDGQCVDDGAHEGEGEHCAGFVFGDAAGAEVEDLVRIEGADGRAVACHDVIVVDLQVGLGESIGPFGEEEITAHLVRLGAASGAVHDGLTIEDGGSMSVEEPAEVLPAGAVRGVVVDAHVTVGQGAFVHVVGASEITFGTLLVKVDVQVEAGEFAAKGDGVGAIVAIAMLANGDVSDEMAGVILETHVFEPCAGMEDDLQDLIAQRTLTAKGLHQSEANVGRDFEENARVLSALLARAALMMKLKGARRALFRLQQDGATMGGGVEACEVRARREGAEGFGLVYFNDAFGERLAKDGVFDRELGGDEVADGGEAPSFRLFGRQAVFTKGLHRALDKRGESLLVDGICGG